MELEIQFKFLHDIKMRINDNLWCEYAAGFIFISNFSERVV